MRITTTADLRDRFRAFRNAAKSAVTLANFLGTDVLLLERLGLHPQYKTFHLPKNEHGDLRLIEDPPPALKKVQAALNHSLQGAYYFEKSYSGYGFVVNPVTDEDKRNILTNARRHLKKKYLLQYDLLDFFHTVTTEKIQLVFESPPFCFSEDVCDLLTAITTCQGRLPMGAPTSPVLSNFACRNLDEQLMALAQAKLWTFTRYADDFTFSANRPFEADDQCAIHQIIEQEGFRVNDRKTRLSGPDDDKIVTGILLRGKGELRPGFLEETRQEVEQLATVVKAQHYHGELRTHWTEKMKQHTRGKITFIGFVLGTTHPDYMAVRDAYYTACAPPEAEFGAVSWRGFHYLT